MNETLTIYDYCDADADSQIQAQVRMVKGDQVLDFCGHHFRKYRKSLFAAGFRVASTLTVYQSKGIFHVTAQV